MRTNPRSAIALFLAMWLVVGGVSPGIAQPNDDPAAEAGMPGYLLAVSDPPGAWVYVDDVLAGVAPLGPIAVEPGEHRVWFRTRAPEQFEPIPLSERRFTAATGDTTWVVEAMGSLARLETDPIGATVTVDERVLGVTPLDIRWFPPRLGPAPAYTVTREPYPPVTLSATELRQGGVIRVSLRDIEPDIDPKVVSSGAGQRLNWPAWLLLAGSAVSASAAVYFKGLADDSYDQYLATALPSVQDDLLAEANRYDRVSTTAWASAQIGFLLSAWFFARGMLKLDEAPLSPDVSVDRGETLVGARWRY